MNISFRNGIIARQETSVNLPSYLIFTSGSPYSTVSLDVVDTPFIATFINGDNNYTIQEFHGYKCLERNRNKSSISLFVY